MRPLLRCHLEIPKNCQISHGRRRLTEIRAVTWWRRQNSSANRQTKPGGGGIWLARKHLIIPLILIFQKAIGSCQSTLCHLIVQVRVGRPWRKLSQSGRGLFTRLFGRSAVLLSSQGVRWTRWVAWPWTWWPYWVFFNWSGDEDRDTVAQCTTPELLIRMANIHFGGNRERQTVS